MQKWDKIKFLKRIKFLFLQYIILLIKKRVQKSCLGQQKAMLKGFSRSDRNE